MKKYFFSIVLILSFILFNCTSAYETHNGGNISGTWGTGTTHYISSSITIQDNQTLTIEAGCVIKFASGTELIVYGTLNANGSAENYIVFTSNNDNSYGEIISGSTGLPAPADWRRIYVYGGGDNDGYAFFDYCRVRYAGGTSASYDHNIYLSYCDNVTINNSIIEYSSHDGINMYSSYPTINNSTISNNLRYGLYCDGDYIEATAPTIINNIFNNNSNYAAYLINTKIFSYSGNSGSGNGKNGIGIQGEIKSNVTLSCGSSTFPFILIGNVVIQDNCTLAFSPGTIIKAAYVDGRWGELTVYGTLDVNGTADSNIVFTSLKDDSYGGDTNGDGSATLPAPADWRRIYVYGGGDNDGYAFFDYCRVRYAGGTSTSYDHNLYLSYCDNVTINNSIIEYSSHDGINMYSSYPTINNSTISNNLRYGLYCDGDYIEATAPTIINNIFNNNSNYAAYLINTKIFSYSGNSGSGNGKNGIGIQGEIKSNVTLSCGSSTFPFILIGNVVIQDNCTLAFSPGTIIKAAADRLIRVKNLEASGWKYLRYAGPSGTVRPFCVEHIGRVYSIDEIKGMVNMFGQPALYYQGGYNCRHRWDPVEGSVIEDTENGRIFAQKNFTESRDGKETAIAKFRIKQLKQNAAIQLNSKVDEKNFKSADVFENGVKTEYKRITEKAVNLSTAIRNHLRYGKEQAGRIVVWIDRDYDVKTIKQAVKRAEHFDLTKKIKEIIFMDKGGKEIKL